jgi:3-methyladenine DNA glycosylase AlkD
MNHPLELTALMAWLERSGTARNREAMARYGIASGNPFGVSIAALRARAKQIGRDAALADALWRTGRHEARLLAVLISDPMTITPARMNHWTRDFDNWAICDTTCIALFVRTPHAWGRVAAWAPRKDEFVKRAAFALLAALAVHDRTSDDAPFEHGLAQIEAAAGDARNFVKKAVNWALRAIGHRNRTLHGRALAMAGTLAGADDPTARWIGKDALRELSAPGIRLRQPGAKRSKAVNRA